jgi:hypothetical protein
MFIKYKNFKQSYLVLGYYILLDEQYIDGIDTLANKLKIPFSKAKEIVENCGGRIDNYDSDTEFYNFPTQKQAEAALIALKLVSAK